MKIVINNHYGGFNISQEFYDYYKIPYEKTAFSAYTIEKWTENERTDPRLIEYIEQFGSKKASGSCANLVIEEIPKGTKYRICEYDGYESIETEDSIDWKVAE